MSENVWVFVVTSVNNPDDGGASEYGYDPIDQVEVYADADTALLAAESWLQSRVAEGREEADLIEDSSFNVERLTRTSDQRPFWVEVTDWCNVVRAVVFRRPVTEHVPASAVIDGPDELGQAARS
jgi:hypothetical protein